MAGAAEATKLAARLTGTELTSEGVPIVGAAAAIGRVGRRRSGREAGDMILVRSRLPRLEVVASSVRAMSSACVEISAEMGAIRQTDAIVTVTRAPETLIDSRDLNPGATVCDAGRSRDLSPW